MHSDDDNGPRSVAFAPSAPSLRERVLDEIRRMAAENGGRAPGCHRFNRVSGLSHAVWHGQIWARWSDAVREAGLTPNDKQDKLEDDDLLAAFAEAARH